MKKRILMRASVSPFAVHKPIDVICQKVIGNNTGNLLFAYHSPSYFYIFKEFSRWLNMDNPTLGLLLTLSHDSFRFAFSTKPEVPSLRASS